VIVNSVVASIQFYLQQFVVAWDEAIRQRVLVPDVMPGGGERGGTSSHRSGQSNQNTHNGLATATANTAATQSNAALATPPRHRPGRSFTNFLGFDSGAPPPPVPAANNLLPGSDFSKGDTPVGLPSSFPSQSGVGPNAANPTIAAAAAAAAATAITNTTTAAAGAANFGSVGSSQRRIAHRKAHTAYDDVFAQFHSGTSIFAGPSLLGVADANGVNGINEVNEVNGSTTATSGTKQPSATSALPPLGLLNTPGKKAAAEKEEAVCSPLSPPIKAGESAEGMEYPEETFRISHTPRSTTHLHPQKRICPRTRRTFQSPFSLLRLSRAC